MNTKTPKTMKAIVFDKLGPPLEVLQIREVPVPEPKDNEVLIKMVSDSINPGDAAFIQGLYPEPKKPVLPQIAGTHGAGIIIKAGKNVSLDLGTFVYFSYVNTWAEYAAVPAEWVIPLPSNYPIEKAPQFGNFVTAWDLVNETKVQSGQWIAITAANSTVSTIAVQLAKQKGMNVIAIVRKKRDHVDLQAIGADEVIELSESSVASVREKVMEITQKKGINGVIDSVGGPVLGELINSLALGAQVIISGDLSMEPFEMRSSDIALKVASIRTYAYRYFFSPPKPEDKGTLQEIMNISSEFQVPVGGMHALTDFKNAIDMGLNQPEKGKRFFTMQKS